MKGSFIFFLMCFLAIPLFATEARIESMGNNSDFLKDDISVLTNPSTCFDFGNLLVGSLGKITTEEGTWKRQEQWFGGWAVYPLSKTLKLGVGATLNRPFSTTKTYESMDRSDFFTVHNPEIDSVTHEHKYAMEGKYIDYLEALDMEDPFGNVYLFTGVSINEDINIGLGGRYAGKDSTTDSSGIISKSYIAVQGGNLGITYRFGNHSLEASVNFNQFVLTKNSASPDVNIDVKQQDINVLLRSFINFSKKNALVGVMSLDKSNLLSIKTQDLGIGAGFNRNLFKGFVWVGMKYEYHLAEFPEQIGGENIYQKETDSKIPPGVRENSHKFIYSFGVEKKMLWDWFALRVGGNKVFEYLEKRDTEKDYIVEKGLFERDVDAVCWGITLGTPDDRLRFDCTVSEEFPYSNIFSGGEDGIINSRISAALKF